MQLPHIDHLPQLTLKQLAERQQYESTKGRREDLAFARLYYLLVSLLGDSKFLHEFDLSPFVEKPQQTDEEIKAQLAKIFGKPKQ